MVKTKAVTRYRTRTVTKRRRSRSNNGMSGISIALIAGFLPGLMYAAEPAMSGQFGQVARRLSIAYSGFDPQDRVWNMGNLAKGAAPVFFGYLVHFVAERIGINKQIKRLLPIGI